MKIDILCSGMTGRIYACRTDSKGNIRDKFEVTKQVINAVMQHMDVTKEEYECVAGDLIFKPKAPESTAQPSEAEADHDPSNI